MSNTKDTPEFVDNPPKKRNFTNKSNLTAEVNNPCRKEELVIYKCLDMNNYDKDECQLQFLNYKNCKDFWFEITRERRRRGVKPYLPLPEERAKIKANYMNSPRKE